MAKSLFAFRFVMVLKLGKISHFQLKQFFGHVDSTHLGSRVAIVVVIAHWKCEDL